MTAETRAALAGLGIADAAIEAMSREAWPAGVSRNPDCWNDCDKRALAIYAANCLCSENLQDIYELDYINARGWCK